MGDLRFGWDSHKDAANQRKHGISFSEAETVFSDTSALFLHDPEHSLHEERFLLLGLSSALKFLVVSHTFREKDDVIRIISARKATRAERDQYGRRWQS